MFRRLVLVLTVAGLALLAGAGPTAERGKPGREVVLPDGVPPKVARVLKHVDETREPPPGYEGGRHFGNFENRLPRKDRRGRSIRYQEWDVNPKVPGKNRGAERLVTGSDGSAYYTRDHYRSFIRIR